MTDDAPVTVHLADDAFAARIAVLRLEGEGIAADAPGAALARGPLDAAAPVAVRVAADDAERARAILATPEPADELVDDDAPARPATMPPLARLALVVTVAVAVLALVGLLWMAIA